MKWTAIILAGGKSRRMGQDKGLTEYGGKPLVQYSIDACRRLTSEVFISTGNGEYSRFGLPLIEDNYQECGPIGGIEAALSVSKTDGIIVCPCDMPGISSGMLEKIIQRAEGKEAVVAVSPEGKVFPVLGCYRKAALPVIQNQIKKGDYKMLSLLKELDAGKVVVSSDELLANVNYPEDLQ